MRLLYFLLLFALPASAQINRSAQQLAEENIGQYIQKQLFKDKNYQSLHFDALQPVVLEEHHEQGWRVKHEFSTAPVNNTDGKSNKPQKFVFYLNKKMQVVKSEFYD